MRKIAAVMLTVALALSLALSPTRAYAWGGTYVGNCTTKEETAAQYLGYSYYELPSEVRGLLSGAGYSAWQRWESSLWVYGTLEHPSFREGWGTDYEGAELVNVTDAARNDIERAIKAAASSGGTSGGGTGTGTGTGGGGTVTGEDTIVFTLQPMANASEDKTTGYSLVGYTMADRKTYYNVSNNPARELSKPVTLTLHGDMARRLISYQKASGTIYIYTTSQESAYTTYVEYRRSFFIYYYGAGVTVEPINVKVYRDNEERQMLGGVRIRNDSDTPKAYWNTRIDNVSRDATTLNYDDTGNNYPSWYEGSLESGAQHERLAMFGFCTGVTGGGTSGGGSGTGGGNTTNNNQVYDNDTTNITNNITNSEETTYNETNNTYITNNNVDVSAITQRLDAMNAKLGQLGRDLAQVESWLDEDWRNALDTMRDWWNRLFSWLNVIDGDIRALQTDTGGGGSSGDLSGIEQQLEDVKGKLDALLVAATIDAAANVAQAIMELINGLLSKFGDALGVLKDAMGELSSVFPFSLPWDLAALAALFAADPVTPVFDLAVPDFGQIHSATSIHVDLHDWDDVAAVVRSGELVLFATDLIMRTREMMGAGSDDVC